MHLAAAVNTKVPGRPLRRPRQESPSEFRGCSVLQRGAGRDGAGASSGRLGNVYVGGNVTNSYFETGGPLSSLFAQGNLTNTSVQAGSLSAVYVRGTISEDSTDGDTDAIHAGAGSYFVIDSTKFAQITPTVSESFAGVAASTG